MARIVIFLLLLVLIEASEAHGSLHDQIDAASAQMKKHPHDADVLMKRGRLRLQSGSYDSAIDDFHTLLAIDPKNIPAHYYLAEAYFAQKNIKRAIQHSNRFIQQVTGKGAKSRGLELLGRIQVQAKHYSEAIQAYEQLLHLTRLPKPEYYLALASAYNRAENSDRLSSVRVLDQGMRTLGMLPVLQKKSIEYELQTHNPEKAILRVDRLIDSNPHSFAYLKLKADILWQLDRQPEAISVYQSSIAILDKLPLSRKNSPGIIELRKSMESRL